MELRYAACVTTTRVAIGIVGACWIAVLITMAACRRPSRQAQVHRRDAVGGIGIALQAIGFGLTFGGNRRGLASSQTAWALAAFSVVIAALSTTFVVVAMRTLGKQWSLLPRLVKEHVLLEQGPYGVVRHPIYLGMLGLMIATGLAIGATPVLLIAVAAYVLGTMLRIRREEALLHQRFGRKFDAYAARIPALVPSLGRWRETKAAHRSDH